MNKFLFYIIILQLIVSCEPKFDYGEVDFNPQIIVEGWIENDGVAHVILTQSIPLDGDFENIAVNDIPIRWAKVSVSDGTNTEILTGRMDYDYSPPFIYKGVNIKGEIGKNYTLKVEYSGRILTSKTTIPPEITYIDDYEVVKCNESDSLYQLNIRFKDNTENTNYYKIFTKVYPVDSRYFSSFMGTIQDDILPIDGNSKLTVNRALRYELIGEYTPYFKKSDTVMVKLTQIEKPGFDFWSAYDNEVANGKNPLFPSSSNLKSNISGGKGIWCGYSRDIKKIIISNEIRQDIPN